MKYAIQPRAHIINSFRYGVSLMDTSQMPQMRQKTTSSTCTLWSSSASHSIRVTLWACWSPFPASSPPYRWCMLSPATTTLLREWPLSLSKWAANPCLCVIHGVINYHFFPLGDQSDGICMQAVHHRGRACACVGRASYHTPPETGCMQNALPVLPGMLPSEKATCA